MEWEYRIKPVQIIGVLLMVVLPLGILLAWANAEVDPRVPTIPGISFTYNEGISIDGQVGLVYKGGAERMLDLGPTRLEIYTAQDPDTPVERINVYPHTITVAIQTDDPEAVCEVSIHYSMRWDATDALVQEIEADTTTKVTLGTKSGYTVSRQISTSEYYLLTSDCFAASPAEDSTSTWQHVIDVTATFTYLSGKGAIPAPFYRVASRQASISLVFRNEYTYEGSASVSGSEQASPDITDSYTCGICGAGPFTADELNTHLMSHGIYSILPIRPLTAGNIPGRKGIVIAWEYIILEIIGIALIAFPYVKQVIEEKL